MTKQENISIEFLTKMYNALYTDKNVYYQRIICACFIGYSGFLRSNELLSIKRSDIIMYTTHMSIFLEKSKTDIYRDGAWIILAQTNCYEH